MNGPTYASFSPFARKTAYQFQGVQISYVTFWQFPTEEWSVHLVREQGCAILTA